MPIVICLIVISGVLVWTGLQTPIEGEMSTWQTFGHVIGNGNSYLALVAGGAAGLIVAGTLAMLLSKVSWELVAMGTAQGMFQMLPAMAVLWLAWGLSSLTATEQLNTGGYLASILDTRLPVEWLPTCVFLLAAFIAFSTGTSWGTMAILTPLSVALSVNLQEAALAASDTVAMAGLQSTTTASLAMSPICLATFSSVLAGAIFGDHCSPLSDTTVLSSRACDCNHVLHVRTQMPYALVVGVTCILFGTLPASWGISPWISLLVSAAVLWLIVRVLGKPPQTAAP